MTVPKFIYSLFSSTFLALVFYSTSAKKSLPAYISNLDTIYSASTRLLKSNTIPDSIFKMINLRHLEINGMDCDYGDRTNCWMINEIPAQIISLKHLTTLRLTLNAIKTVPKELIKLNNLRLIDLTDNSGLIDIDNISKTLSLEYLYLNGCGLTKLPEDIGNLKNLKELNLVGNNFDEKERERVKNALPNCIIKL